MERSNNQARSMTNIGTPYYIDMSGNGEHIYKSADAPSVRMRTIFNENVSSVFDAIKEGDIFIGELANIRSGIYKEHIKTLSIFSIKENIFLGIRPVEMTSTGLIASGCATKPLCIKGKSSNWGVTAGYIPTNQCFSKLKFNAIDECDFNKKVTKYNNSLKKLFEDGLATQIELSLSRSRVDELLSLSRRGTLKDKLEITFETSNEIILKSSSSDSSLGHDINFILSKEDGLETYSASVKNYKGEYEKLSVVANSQTMMPITADYDLLTVAVDMKYSNSMSLKPQIYPRMGDDNSLKFIPSYSHGYKNSAGESVLVIDHTDENNLVHTEYGNCTPYTESLIPKLNKALGFSESNYGNRVFHHDMDSLSGYCDEASNYPSSFFTPIAIGEIEAGSLLLINNTRGLSSIVRLCKDNFYNISISEQWKDQFSIRSSNFMSAISRLKDK